MTLRKAFLTANPIDGQRMLDEAKLRREADKVLNTEYFTLAQVEAIVKADRERLIKEIDDWLCDCKKLQPYVLEHHHFNCALGYALIRIRTTPIEIGEGE